MRAVAKPRVAPEVHDLTVRPSHRGKRLLGRGVGSEKLRAARREHGLCACAADRDQKDAPARVPLSADCAVDEERPASVAREAKINKLRMRREPASRGSATGHGQKPPVGAEGARPLRLDLHSVDYGRIVPALGMQPEPIASAPREMGPSDQTGWCGASPAGPTGRSFPPAKSATYSRSPVSSCAITAAPAGGSAADGMGGAAAQAAIAHAVIQPFTIE